MLSIIRKKLKLKFYEIQIFGFPWCSTREDLSIDVSITNVGLILTKLGRFLFSGYGQTDRVLESSHGNMSAHKKFQLKAQIKWLAVDRYMHPRSTGMHNDIVDRIRSHTVSYLLFHTNTSILSFSFHELVF